MNRERVIFSMALLMATNTALASSFYMSATAGPALPGGIGFDMGIVNIEKLSKIMSTKFCGGYMWLFTTEDDNSYEDYTDVLGTINPFDDRFDGTFSNNRGGGIGVYCLTKISRNDRILLLSSFGFGTSIENNYDKYYDALQILGNDGKYFIDSTNKDDRKYGVDIGANVTFPLFKSSDWIYGLAGAMMSSYGIFTIKVGLAAKLGM